MSVCVCVVWIGRDQTSGGANERESKHMFMWFYNKLKLKVRVFVSNVYTTQRRGEISFLHDKRMKQQRNDNDDGDDDDELKLAKYK